MGKRLSFCVWGENAYLTDISQASWSERGDNLQLTPPSKLILPKPFPKVFFSVPCPSFPLLSLFFSLSPSLHPIASPSLSKTKVGGVQRKQTPGLPCLEGTESFQLSWPSPLLPKVALCHSPLKDTLPYQQTPLKSRGVGGVVLWRGLGFFDQACLFSPAITQFLPAPWPREQPVALTAAGWKEAPPERPSLFLVSYHCVEPSKRSLLLLSLWSSERFPTGPCYPERLIFPLDPNQTPFISHRKAFAAFLPAVSSDTHSFLCEGGPAPRQWNKPSGQIRDKNCIV